MERFGLWACGLALFAWLVYAASTGRLERVERVPFDDQWE